MKLRISIKRLSVFLAMMSAIALLGKAQSNMVSYPVKDQFNSSDFNPAFLTAQHQYTFSIFPLAGMSVGYNDQSVINKMLKNFLSGNKTPLDTNALFNSLTKRELFYQRFESSLLNFGYNTTYGSFSFRIKDVELLMLNLKGNFSNFLVNPSFNTLIINQPQMFPADLVHYREYSIGFAKEIIKNKLYIGLRTKLYFGKASLVSEIQGELVRANNSFYLRTSGSVKLSAPVNIVLNDLGILQPFVLNSSFTPANYLFNSKNVGTGFDFGIRYRFNPRIEFSASVVDLGKINWKDNGKELFLKGEYEFPQEYTVGSNANSLTKNPNFANAPVNYFSLFKVTYDKTVYSTPLPANFYIGLQYLLNPKLNIGVVDRYISMKGLTQNSFSLTSNYELSKKVNLSTGYSIIGYSYFNVPFAILYKWDSGQTFFGTNNLFSFLLPSAAEFSGVTFGICFYLFQKRTKYIEQIDYQPFYKEKKVHAVTKKGLIFNNYPKS
jgi:hypothetical protein